MNKIKSAVVGAGFIGPVHVEALRRLGVTITGICGCDESESISAAKSLGLPRAYANFQEVLQDQEVDAVHLAVPNVLHYDFAKQALKAGKHVMCEKPLAMNSKESAALVKLAAQSGLEAGVCYNIRFYPLCLEARDLVQKGEIGDITAIHGSYIQDWLLYDTDYNWRVLADQGGELRAVSDIGTHWMDLIASITGLEVSEVLADLNTIHKTRKRPLGEVETFSGKGKKKQVKTETIKITTDDFGTILFRFENGAKGSVTVSQVTAGRKNCVRYEISGSKAALAWNSETPNEMWIGSRDQANQTLIRDPALLGKLAGGFSNYPGGHCEGFPDTFKQCFRAFYTAVAANKTKKKSKKCLYPSFAAGHHEIKLCDAILESHKKQRWVKLKK